MAGLTIAATVPANGSTSWGTAVNTTINEIIAEAAPEASPTFTGLVTTAGQIKFPASQNSSADLNTLDDYEEGTWTPVLTGTSGGSVSMDRQYGKYTKVGNLIAATFWVSASAAGTLAGNLQITGLPSASSDANMGRPGSALRFYGLQNHTKDSLYAWIAPSDNKFQLTVSDGAGSMADCGANVIKSGSELSGSITYMMA